MITEDCRLVCDGCGCEADTLTSYDGDAPHFCDGCVRKVELYYGTVKVGKYVLYPDGEARVWYYDEAAAIPYWATMAWERCARAGKSPLNVQFQVSSQDEEMTRRWLQE